MGQATVDLPDPLEPALAPATPAGADDLLAQLAGDEIDRLLAEAEVEQAPGAAPAAGLSELDAAFDAALSTAPQQPTSDAPATQETLPVVAPPMAPVPATAPTISQQMQQVFEEITHGMRDAEMQVLRHERRH